MFFSIFQGIILIGAAIFAFYVAAFILNIGQGLVSSGSIASFALPRWIRWIMLVPAIVISSIVLIIVFNIIFWIGDLFGGSFVGTAWLWGVTFFQSVVLPSMLVTISYTIAPKGRKWVAITVMITMWMFLVSFLIDPDSGKFLPFEFLIHGSLIVAAVSAGYAGFKGWVMSPGLDLLELEIIQRSELGAG